jgi:triosephosphate isomerase
MTDIFVNLKRFDVPREKGGICPCDSPKSWIEQVVGESIRLGLGVDQNIHVVYLVPESLIIPAQEKLLEYPEELRKGLEIGCQSVYRHNIRTGGNFGAFTSNLPAASAWQMGCGWTMIGHSEERRDKQEIIATFEPQWNAEEISRTRCAQAVDMLINQEVLAALTQDMNVLLCVGETAEERGDGSFDEQKKRIARALSYQLSRGLEGVCGFLPQCRVVVGYEPVWAIGPGKTPPGGDYIAFVSGFIKDKIKQLYGVEMPVIYGGGLKEANAAMLSDISTIDGGLVALTRFSGEIGFFVEDLKNIIDKYIEKKGKTHEA